MGEHTFNLALPGLDWSVPPGYKPGCENGIRHIMPAVLTDLWAITSLGPYPILHYFGKTFCAHVESMLSCVGFFMSREMFLIYVKYFWNMSIHTKHTQKKIKSYTKHFFIHKTIEIIHKTIENCFVYHTQNNFYHTQNKSNCFVYHTQNN